MSDYTEALREDGARRVVIVNDTDAEQPDGDGFPHVFRVESNPYGSGPRVELVHADWQRDGEAKGLAGALSEAFARWGHDGDMVLRYLRAWHGVVSFDYVSSNTYAGSEGTFYGITTRGLAESWGLDPDSDAARTSATDSLAADWQAWLDGDVWGYVVQERVTWTAPGHEPVVKWEATDDSCWGFYGREYAVEQALEAFAT